MKYQRRDCPRCEYVDSQKNLAACVPTDAICEHFQGKPSSHPPMAEAVKTVEKKQTVSFQPFIALPDRRLVEQAYDGKDVYFLVYDPNSENVITMTYIELEDKIVTRARVCVCVDRNQYHHTSLLFNRGQ